jgi:tryptophan synthase alpha chain
MSNKPNLIDAKFAALKQQGATALIPFLTVGDPTPELTVAIIHELEKAGADLVELGVPYSDPLADGPVIQGSSLRALQHGISILDCINVARIARSEGSQLPFILFTYFNPVLQVGLERIFKLAQESGISGLIIPDLPHEEDGEVRSLAASYGLHLIPLVAPTSQERIRKIAAGATGFIYCVSSLGVTGVRSDFHSGIDSFLSTVRETTTLPIAVGFGISSREQVARFESTCDGVVVGSAIVRKIAESVTLLQYEATKEEGLLQIRQFVRQLKG